MEEKTIKLLEINEMKILNQIIIISDMQNCEMELGRILYTRPLTVNYNLKKQQEEKKENVQPFTICQDYSKQNNYKFDRLDEIILESVKKKYPKASIISDTIFFDVDLEKINIFKKRYVMKSDIVFNSEPPNITNFQSFTYKPNEQKFDINIYSNSHTQLLNCNHFYAFYKATEHLILDTLSTVSFK